MSVERRQFAVAHLAYHLSEANQNEALYRLLSEEWRSAHLELTGSYASFVQDVTLAIDAAAKRFPDDLAILWRAVLTKLQSTEVSANVSPTVLGLLAKLGRYEQAMGYAALVADPDQRSRSYTQIGAGLLERGRDDLAVVAARQALAAAESVGPVVSRAHALAGTARLAIRVHADEIVSSCITALLQGARGQWTEHVVAQLVPDLVSAERRSDLRQLVAITRGFRADPNDSSHFARTCGSIASGFGDLGMFLELHDFISRLKKTESGERRAMALAQVVPGVARLRDPNLIDQIARSSTTADFDEEIAVAYASLGNLERAVRFLRRSGRRRRGSPGQSDDDRRVRNSRALGRVGLYGKAMAVARAIVKPHVRSQALLSIGRSALAASEVTVARKAARRAMFAARLVDPEDIESGALHAPVEAMVHAAELLWDVGARRRAVSTAVEMLRMGEYLCDPTYGPDALVGVVALLGRAHETRHLEDAIEVAEAIEDATFRDQAYGSIVAAFVSVDAVDRAVALGNEHGFVVADQVAARRLAVGDEQTASAMIDQVLQSAMVPQVHNAAAEASRTIAEALIDIGRRDEGIRAAARALELTKQMRPTTMSADVFANGEKALALARLANTFARVGADAIALETARLALAESNPTAPRMRSSITGNAWRNGVAIWGLGEHVLAECAPVFAGAGRDQEILDLGRQWVGDVASLNIAIALGDTLLNRGDLAAAIRRVEDAWKVTRDAYRTDPVKRSPAALVGFFTRAGAFDRALDAASYIDEVPERTDSLSRLVEVSDGATRRLVAARARADADVSTDASERVTLLCLAAIAFHRGERPADATACVVAASNACEIPPLDNDALARARVAQALSELGDRGRARTVADSALALARTEAQPDAYTWRIVTRVGHRIRGRDEPNVAVAAAIGLPDHTRVRLLRAITPALVEVGDANGLRDVADALRASPASPTHEDQIVALADVAAGLFELGEVDVALRLWQEGCVASATLDIAAAMNLLNRGAPMIAQIDEGRTLWACFESAINPYAHQLGVRRHRRLPTATP